MRCALLVIALLLVGCVLPSGQRGADDPRSGPKSEPLPVVLKPINAILHEKGDLVVNAVETRIKPNAGTPFEFRKAQFIGRNYGWAMTDKSVFKTANGGKTWERVELNVPEDSHISSLFFIDESHGWLAEIRQVDSERYGLGNSSRVMVSDDGGSSWNEQASFPDEVKIRDIKFLNAKDGLAIGAKVVDQRPPYDEILVLSTADGGKVWNDTSEVVKAAIKNQYGRADATGWSIHWTSALEILLLTNHGTVIDTSDRGRTWKKIVAFKDERPDGSISSTGYHKLLFDTHQKIRVIAGASGDEGYWGDLVVNNDDGSWTSFELARTPILDALFLSDKELIACGRGIWAADDKMKPTLPATGIILHSSDNGKNWFPIYRSKSDETFISLTRVNGNDFYAVSDLGTFLRFTLSDR